MIGRFFNWLDRVFEERDELGLTKEERSEVLDIARQGESGRDDAERLACTGYGWKTSQFYDLLDQVGISTK